MIGSNWFQMASDSATYRDWARAQLSEEKEEIEEQYATSSNEDEDLEELEEWHEKHFDNNEVAAGAIETATEHRLSPESAAILTETHHAPKVKKPAKIASRMHRAREIYSKDTDPFGTLTNLIITGAKKPASDGTVTVPKAKVAENFEARLKNFWRTLYLMLGSDPSAREIAEILREEIKAGGVTAKTLKQMLCQMAKLRGDRNRELSKQIIRVMMVMNELKIAREKARVESNVAGE